jgi:hypothetical protein
MDFKGKGSLLQKLRLPRSGKGFDHSGSYILNLSLYFYKRLFLELEP